METWMRVVKSRPGRPSECVIHSPERTDLGSIKMEFCWAVMQSSAAMYHVTEHFHVPRHTVNMRDYLGRYVWTSRPSREGAPVRKAICYPAFHTQPFVSIHSLLCSPGWVHYFSLFSHCAPWASLAWFLSRLCVNVNFLVCHAREIRSSLKMGLIFMCFNILSA